MSPRGHWGDGPPPWHDGNPPPWWPENAQWPPHSSDDWRSGGRRFLRRAVRVAVALLVMLALVIGAVVWLLLSAFGVTGSANAERLVSVAALLLAFVLIAAVVMVLRGLARRAGAFVDAAQRVERGDYSARVPLRGPRELRSIARAFNAMSARLESEEVRRRSALADVAHELRTPLTIVRGQAEALADGVYPADAAHLQPILAATATMERLIEDLRTAALAEAGSLHLDLAPVDLAGFLHEAVAPYMEAAAGAGVRLSSHAPAAEVTLDPGRMRSVVGNLVGNALRHTAAGGVVEVAGSADAAGAAITVRDTGEGIVPELVPRVFERFARGAASDGSGLGLAIARDIVEAHGGSIAVVSAPGAGATFTVRLPALAP